ncbi:hypothetical protein [Streptomyces sp. L2]|uniref:hypothetical protein n=1 Tax=Streptomyces sp. L2 TaxID=2162665 RepID=UPI0013E956EE|nr:hypothetical protein [Streptomyces sp. L2]
MTVQSDHFLFGEAGQIRQQHRRQQQGEQIVVAAVGGSGLLACRGCTARRRDR